MTRHDAVSGTHTLPNILGGLGAALDDLQSWRALVVADRYPDVNEVELDRYLDHCIDLLGLRRELAEGFVSYRTRVPG